MGASALQKDVWHREAVSIARRNGIQLRRWGMRVTVYDDANPSNDGDYVLTYGLVSTNRKDNNNWLKVADIAQTWGGGGGGSYTFSNGLTETGGAVVLGGPLTQDTTLSGEFSLTIPQLTSLYMGGAGAATLQFSTGLTVNSDAEFNGDSFNVNANAEFTGDSLTVNNSLVTMNLTSTEDADALNLNDSYTNSGINIGYNIGGIDIYSSNASYAVSIGHYSGNGSGILVAENNVIISKNSPTLGGIQIISGGTSFQLAPDGTHVRNIIYYDFDESANYTDDTLPAWKDVKAQIGGNAVDTLIQNPTITQDGYVIAWNQTNLEWELVAQSGGGSPGGADTEIQINAAGSFGGGKVYIPSDGNMVLGDASTAGGRSIFMDSSEATPDFLIGTETLGQIRFRKSSNAVSIKTSLTVYSDSTFTTPIGGMGNFSDPLNTGGSERRVHTYETFTFGTTYSDAVGALLKIRGASATASVGNTARTGPVLISAGRSSAASPAGDLSIGDILINSYEPANAGTYGNLSIWNSVVEASPDFEAGEKIIYIGNAITAPNANATDGFFFYSNNGEAEILNATGPVQKLSGRATRVTEAGSAVALTQAHRGAIVKLTNAGAVTVTLSDLGADFQCTILYTGSGTVSFGGYNTFNSAGGADQITAQYGMAYLYHESTNNWYASGDLV